ncbi:MAG: NAD(P)/FAD-dependent oxidoreductase [Rhodoglobus sp.]
MPSAYSAPSRTDQRIVARSLSGAERSVFWTAHGAPAAEDALRGNHDVDLLVVGGGYTGLWTALLAKERQPDLRVMIVEAERIGWAASGRNGGFCEASLTHGEENGERHFAKDLELLGRLGRENLDEIGHTLLEHGIDAEFERTGILQVATEIYQLDGLKKTAQDAGEPYLNEASVQALVHSPLYRGAVHLKDDVAMLHPAKLAWGLRRACLDSGVQIVEGTAAKSLARDGRRLRVTTEHGIVTATKVALATNAFPSLLRRVNLLTTPVYDYALMTEPLTAAQMSSIGWEHRFGIADLSRQFHYYRLTADNRILFGGYDAIYHRGGRIEAKYDDRPETFEKLADHFFRTFPQLEETNFSHAWGGAIDMSTQLAAHSGTGYGGSVAYTVGYTGLGVGASRFGARVMLDLLDGADTELTQLKMARRTPLPMPPEPIAFPAISLIRNAVARADEREGRDGPLLKAMGLLGIGFDT